MTLLNNQNSSGMFAPFKLQKRLAGVGRYGRGRVIPSTNELSHACGIFMVRKKMTKVSL